MNRYDSREALMAALAATVAGELATALDAQPTATLAVPGGTTPGPFLSALSTAPLDWFRVRVMLTDERFVPETSERSNTRLLRGTLLQNAAAVATMVPFYRQGDRPEDVLEALTADIAMALPLDVCVLGMGADMHTASIFPGADLLEQALAADAPPLLPMRAPGAPEPRLTLTAPVLSAARNLHILIQGADKAEALTQAQATPTTAEAPIRLALQAGATIHWAA
ncbi:6-phosphogluconolactonase [Monaibacterium marinum]|uniref:6-phosphogluconolactonase n=1 Tax=Pontivivens marinum TaxID=1690039 RepID=A0A2C9CNF6_9RHOB|nr:6-phosphogluconolactonase [Monaibacterium marinum]SOH92730.1 6-phosphogluconolactonase [Monaibacterium marinum]